MGEMIIDDIPDAHLKVLEARAAQQGISLEDLLRNLIIREAHAGDKPRQAE